MAKPVPGPTFRLDSSLPCGCRIARDPDTQRLRLWYCTAHASAFEMMDALRCGLDALASLTREAPASPEMDEVRGVEYRGRLVLRRAIAGV